jgi:hypothetical protein
MFNKSQITSIKFQTNSKHQAPHPKRGHEAKASWLHVEEILNNKHQIPNKSKAQNPNGPKN